MSKEKFVSAIYTSYAMSGATIYLGAGILNGEVIGEAKSTLR